MRGFGEEEGLLNQGEGCGVHGEEALQECGVCGTEFCRRCHPRTETCPDCSPSADEKDTDDSESGALSSEDLD